MRVTTCGRSCCRTPARHAPLGIRPATTSGSPGDQPPLVPAGPRPSQVGDQGRAGARVRPGPRARAEGVRVRGLRTCNRRRATGTLGTTCTWPSRTRGPLRPSRTATPVQLRGRRESRRVCAGVTDARHQRLDARRPLSGGTRRRIRDRVTFVPQILNEFEPETDWELGEDQTFLVHSGRPPTRTIGSTWWRTTRIARNRGKPGTRSAGTRRSGCSKRSATCSSSCSPWCAMRTGLPRHVPRNHGG